MRSSLGSVRTTPVTTKTATKMAQQPLVSQLDKMPNPAKGTEVLHPDSSGTHKMTSAHHSQMPHGLLRQMVAQPGLHASEDLRLLLLHHPSLGPLSRSSMIPCGSPSSKT